MNVNIGSKNLPADGTVGWETDSIYFSTKEQYFKRDKTKKLNKKYYFNHFWELF